MFVPKTEDLQLLQRAVDLSRLCVPTPTAYCVGAVVVTASGEIFSGYTHQTGPADHAEEAAIANARAAGADLRGAAIYSSMEPCTHRKSKPVSCTDLIIKEGFARVVYALGEPPALAECCGHERLERAGIEVIHIPGLGGQVERINAHILNCGG